MIATGLLATGLLEGEYLKALVGAAIIYFTRPKVDADLKTGIKTAGADPRRVRAPAGLRCPSRRSSRARWAWCWWWVESCCFHSR